MSEPPPVACFQLRRRTDLKCQTCDKPSDPIHVPTRFTGYFCWQCCPACRLKPASLKAWRERFHTEKPAAKG
jgi:hypothetical protein